MNEPREELMQQEIEEALKWDIPGAPEHFRILAKAYRSSQAKLEAAEKALKEYRK